MVRWTALLAIPFIGPILAFTVGPFMGARRGALYFPSKKRPLSLYVIGFSWAIIVPFIISMVFRTFLGPTFIFGTTEILISLSLFSLIFISFLLGVSSTKVFTIQERLDGLGWDDILDDFEDDKELSNVTPNQTKKSDKRTRTSKDKKLSNQPKSKTSISQKSISERINSKKKNRKASSSKDSDFLESMDDKKEDEDSQPSVFSVLAQKRRQK